MFAVKILFAPCLLTALSVLIHVDAAVAQGRPQSLDELPPLHLGEIPHLADEAAAKAFCSRHDIVVWASPDIGLYYLGNSPEYGRRMPGFYSCLTLARRADYWDKNPFSTVPDSGRVFPIDPTLLGPGV